MRCSSFCRRMLPRARLWTARTSRPPNLRSGRLPWFNRVTSIEGNHRMGSRSGAEENRSSALPAAIARHGDFAPTSTVPGASCRGHPSLALSGVTRGERDTAIASRACMARERQGRAAPGFREEIRRSPTRGTFHHEVVREGTKAPAARQAERQCADAFFTAKEYAWGTPARTLAARSIGSGGRRTSLSSIDRSAPCDFCVRV